MLHARLLSVTYVQVGGDCHVDLLAVGRDTVQQHGVVQGTIPRSLEAEEYAIVAGVLYVVRRKKVQREDRVLRVGILPLRRVAYAAHDQLLDVAPHEVGPVLVNNGDRDAALDALVEKEVARARHVVTVVHHSRYVPKIKMAEYEGISQ